MNNAANVFTEAAEYQANEVQRAAYARSQAASQEAALIYSDALNVKQMADAVQESASEQIAVIMAKKDATN